MTPQKTIYITVYLLLLIPTLSIALVTRIFSLKVMMLDGFSSNIIFLITCILCTVLYLIFKTSIDGYILPILCKCSKIQLAIAESVTKEATKLATKQEANLPSYQEHYDAVAEKKRIEAEETLQRVLDYTMQTMVIYMSEAELDRLCSYITEYSLGDTPREVSPVSVDSALKSIDLMHFGWNIGKAFGKRRIHTATFIKNVFAHALRDIEVSTIERKMSHTESECRIKLDHQIVLLHNRL
ncbi:MAG: mobilization protein [Paludibacteraceae bacterium]|nr:mobilization protein [Paludibacteraceae bacterium]